MLKIISNTPIYAWIFLVFILWKGFKASKPHCVAWKDLVIFPLMMTGWSLYVTFTKYQPSAFLYWILCFSAGIGIGFLMIRSIKMRVDKKRIRMELPGSWVPLLLMAIIFSIRYFLGVMYGMYPHLKGGQSLFVIECVAAMVSGTLTGRLLALFRFYRGASHTDLA